MNRVLIEWKMIMRCKYLSQSLITMVFLTIILYFLIISNPIIKEHFVWRLIILVGLFSLPGPYLGIFSMGTMSSFFEKIMICPISLFRIILPKYYIYCSYSTIVLLFALLLNFGVDRWEFIASYLFANGFMLFAFIRCSTLGNNSLDIKASGFQNWTKSSYESLFAVLIFGIAAGFMAALYWLFGYTITLVSMSLVGVFFISTHRYWIKSICLTVEKTKYHRLECYRKNGE